MKSILDPKFKYTNSASTNIRKLFKRVRAETQTKQPKLTPIISINRKVK